MKFDKLYICGLSHSGKSLMLELLDGHSNIYMCPYSEFSLSSITKSFIKYLQDKNRKLFFNKFDGNDDELIFNIKISEKEIYSLSINGLIHFIFKNNASFHFLLKSYLTKEYVHYSGDKVILKHNLVFKLDKFILNLNLYLKNCNHQILTIENLDDLILKSYMNSIENSNNLLEDIKYIMKWGSNSIAQISNLHEYYKDFKIIYLYRSIFNRSFSKVIEFINQNNYNANSKIIIKKIIKRSLLSVAQNLIVKEADYLKKINTFANSKNFLYIYFDDLFIKRESTMKKIANFLNLKYEINLNNPSFFGELIDYKKFSENQMILSPKEFFSNKEINFYKKIINNKFLLYIFVSFYKITNKFRKLFNNDPIN